MLRIVVGENGYDRLISVNYITKRMIIFSTAVERSIAPGGSLNDAREAMVNAAVDSMGAYNKSLPGSRGSSAILAPNSGFRLFPLYVLGLLKHVSVSVLDMIDWRYHFDTADNSD